MTDVRISDAELRAAATQGEAAFLQAITRAVIQATGGELTAEAMQSLTAQQVTLWAFSILREEVSQGGFVQLIHNGWGPFFFQNPFARAVKDWGLRDLAKMVYAARDLFRLHGEQITADCTDEEFMALYEQYPDFDPLDDEFVDREDEFVAQAAHYVDEHLEEFVSIEGKP